uniref:Uncharacterized protein n=1 Tax=Mola mola TaxID=94237 RepID=A0A3Q4BY11_MOLML
MSTVSYHISNLLEKMSSADKDFRFMATNDLMLELQKDGIKLDEDSEGKVVTRLLQLLEDKNGEVQNLAVKWYKHYRSLLIRRIFRLCCVSLSQMLDNLICGITGEKCTYTP